MPLGDASRRRNELVGVFGIDAALDGMTPDLDLPLRKRQFSPAATMICVRTMSTPVIHSVTGCSTCTRVFISMK